MKYAVFIGSKKHQSGQTDRIHGLTQLRKAIVRILHELDFSVGRPDGVAHRIVHGGDRFTQPTRLTQTRLSELQKLIPLARTHMPANLAGVRAVRQAWPSVPQWGVFDTALYQSLPDYARLYAIPLSLARRHGIKKYGFHGISHAYALRQAAQKLRKNLKRVNAVTLHLGSGDSMTAWRAGRPVDTSMGFTPLEGLTMATRSGDLDPMVPLFLQMQVGMKPQQVADLLQQRSGMFGISGLRDIRDVLAAAGHPIVGWPKRKWSAAQRKHAKLAVAMFVYDVRRYLASYLGLLPNPKLIVFTGAVGQNAWVRSQILKQLPAARGIQATTVPTDEETAIAEAVRHVVQ